MILSSLPRLLVALCVLPASVWGLTAEPIGRIAVTAPRGKRGSCVGQGIERDIEDAKELVDHAIGVIEPMLSNTPQKDGPWINRYDMAMAMFGIEYIVVPAKKAGGEPRLKISRGMGYLEEALGRYKEVKSRLDNGPESPNSPFILQCGDRDLQWATVLGDLGYTKRGRPDQTPILDKIEGWSLRGRSGIFFSRIWSPGTKDGKAYDYKKAIYLQGGGGSGRGSFCASVGDIASYQRDRVRDNYSDRDTSLVLCDSYFAQKSLATAMGMQHRVRQDLDELTTRGGILLHESLHVITHNIITDQLIEWGSPRQPEKAYEFDKCSALAQAEKARGGRAHLFNADGYRIFAEGIHAIEVNWVRGC